MSFQLSTFHREIARWISAHPARAGALAGWYQQGCGILGSLLTIPLIIRTLGESAAGFWFALIGILSLFTLTDFGFSMAISRQAAYTFKLRAEIDGDPSDLIRTKPGWEGLSELYSASFTLFLRVTAVATVLLTLLFFFVLPHTRLYSSHDAPAATVWCMVGGSLLATFQTRLSQAFLDGIGYMYLSRFISGSYTIFWNALGAGALYLGLGVAGLSTGLLIASIAQFLLMRLVLRKVAAGRLPHSGKPSKELMAQLWRVAVPYGVVGSGGYLVGSALPPLLALILGPAAATPYYVALRIGDTFNAAVSQITSSQGPFFTHEAASGSYRAAKNRFQSTLLVGFILHGCIAAVIYFGSPQLVSYWIGPGHFLSGASLLFFSLNYLVSSWAIVPAVFVLAGGRNPFAITTILHGILTVAGVVMLCPKIGLAGAPLASLIAVLLTNFWYSPLQGWITWKSLHRLASPSSLRAIV